MPVHLPLRQLAKGLEFSLLGLLTSHWVSPHCRLATPVWRLVRGDPLDFATLQQPVADAALHDVGEKAAARYPGYQGMGLQPVGKVSGVARLSFMQCGHP